MPQASNKRVLLESDKGVANGLASLNSSGRLESAQLPTTSTTRTGVSPIGINELVYNVVDFGADSTGVASSSSAVQSAMSAAPEGSTIYFPPGKFLLTPEVVITKARLVFTGPGIVNGTFKVGDGTQRRILNIKFLNLRIIRPLNTTAYPGVGYSSTSALIRIDRVREVEVKGCELYGAAYGIEVVANATAAFHDNAMIDIEGNNFDEVNWAWYSNSHESADLLSLSDCNFRNNVVNKAYKGMFYSSGLTAGVGQDGGHISGNTLFMLSSNSTSNPRWTEKEQGIRIDWADWVHVSENNLFECGKEGILINSARRVVVIGNAVARNGQVEPSSGIKLTGGVGEFINATITGNIIDRYTKHAVEVIGNAAALSLSNSVVYEEATSTYKGSTPLSSIPHSRYELSAVTQLTASRIQVLDGVLSAPWYQDKLPGHSSATYISATSAQTGISGGQKTATIVAGANSIVPMTGIHNSTGGYGGRVEIVAKSATKTSYYSLHIGKNNSTNQVFVMTSFGYLTGVAAEDPSFDWSIVGNSLTATPKGSTLGDFTFYYTTTGDIILG